MREVVAPVARKDEIDHLGVLAMALSDGARTAGCPATPAWRCDGALAQFEQKRNVGVTGSSGRP
jgi:hypothetical protein